MNERPGPAAAPAPPRPDDVQERLAALFATARRTGVGEMIFREIVALRLGRLP